MPKLTSFGLCLLFWLAGYSYCNSQSGAKDFPIDLYSQSKILDTGIEEISIDSLLKNQNGFEFVPIAQSNTNLGFTNHFYWVKFTLNNTTESDQTYFLETARPITDLADLYVVNDLEVEEIFENGDRIPFASRPVKHRKVLFPIKMKAESSQTFFLHLGSDGEVINLQLKLHNDQSLIEATLFDQLIFGVFYGILFLAALTYLFFYFGIKEKSFLLYVAYVSSVALLHFSLDGYYFQFITQGPGWFSDISVLFFAALSAMLFGRYTQVYVRIERFSKKLNKAFNIMVITMMVFMVVILLLDQFRPLYYPLVNAIALFGIIFCIWAVCLSYIRKKPADPFFSIGIALLTIGFITFILNNFSLIPNSFVTENSAKLGTGLEILFLSLSMANRIRLLRTEKEKAQELALQQSQESNEIKSFFLSNVSHELRTPLNAILGLSQSIMKEIQDENIKSNLEVIKYSSFSLLSSIDDILDYSKIENGELNLEQKPFDLQKLLNEVKASAYQQSRDKGLKFSYQEKVMLPQKVVGDSNRFRQILMNVISNSIKFTQQGEIKMLISEIQELDEKTKISFEITDTGVGIKPEKLDRIFESFIQEQIDDKRKFGGFGLGLCIVKALTKLYEGNVQIESKVGQGTTVFLSLTFGKAQEKPSDLIKSQEEQLLQGKKILVVEDNPVNQLVIKSILRKWKGVSYDFANHGIEGLEKLRESHFDLILMDLQMPEMDGYEATQAIRSGLAGPACQNIPIIAVTADTTEKSKVHAKSVGMDDYMTKPVDADLLQEKVLQALFLEKVQLNHL